MVVGHRASMGGFSSPCLIRKMEAKNLHLHKIIWNNPLRLGKFQRKNSSSILLCARRSVYLRLRGGTKGGGRGIIGCVLIFGLRLRYFLTTEGEWRGGEEGGDGEKSDHRSRNASTPAEHIHQSPVTIHASSRKKGIARKKTSLFT